MSWKEKRLITILSIILAVLCAAVLVVLSIRYRAAQAAKDQNTVSPSDIAEAAQSEYVALSYSNGSTTLSFSLNEDGIWTWDQPAFRPPPGRCGHCLGRKSPHLPPYRL